MQKSAEKTLVVLHGGPALAKEYLSGPLSALASYAKLCFLDYPRGGSFPTILSYVVAEIEKIAAQGPYSILAHSWGNPVFFAALPKLTQKPEKAVLVTPFPLRLNEAAEYFGAIRARIVKTTSPDEQARIDEIDKNPTAELDAEYTRLIAPAYVHERRHAVLVDFSSYQRAEASRIFGSMGNFDYSPSLSLLPKETLLLLADSDFLSVRAAEEFEKAITQTHRFHNTGHSPFVECPEEFFSVVGNFLK